MYIFWGSFELGQNNFEVDLFARRHFDVSCKYNLNWCDFFVINYNKRILSKYKYSYN